LSPQLTERCQEAIEKLRSHWSSRGRLVSPEAVDIDFRSAGEIATELRLLWIIDRIRTGRISVGKAAELAGTDRWSFMRTMEEHGVPVIAYSAEDLRKDVATLEY